METFDKFPEPHKHFLKDSVFRLHDDPRILGVAAGGSLLLNSLDQFSDLDLVLYSHPGDYPSVMAERQLIAAGIGPLLESFTGEHVGEPRLLICLYGPPLLHVDLKFVSLEDIHEKVENPLLLWERENLISSQLTKSSASFPQPDPAWIEARFWTWIHYIAAKLGRGELFEAIDAIGFIRGTVLGPLLLARNNARPQGLRKIEFQVTEAQREALKGTLPAYTFQSAILALRKTIELYKELRTGVGNNLAEAFTIQYLDQIEKAFHG